MLGKCFFIICLISCVSAGINGNIGALSSAILNGAGRGVTLSLSMLGMMCLWCGIIEVLRQIGAVRFLSRLMRPLLSRLFPSAFESGEGDEEIVAATAANMLGIANAATPFALSAMEKLDRINPDPERASDDMVTLAVLGTSSINLLPTTVITLRHAAGSVSPYCIIIPVWICSVFCTGFAMLLCRLTCHEKKVRSEGKPAGKMRINKINDRHKSGERSGQSHD